MRERLRLTMIKDPAPHHYIVPHTAGGMCAFGQ